MKKHLNNNIKNSLNSNTKNCLNNNINNYLNSNIKKFKILLCLIIIILTFNSCNKNVNEAYVYSGLFFDTYITVTIYDKADESINQKLTDICEKYDLMFSTDNKESLIYKINNSNSAFIECPKEFIDLMNYSIKYSVSSNGLIDPSIETVSVLWDFNNNNSTVPSSVSINNALKYVNYKNITISNNKISIPNGCKINLGYIAKGYIADQISVMLHKENINNFIINLGGNILCSEYKNNSSAYKIAIEKPFSNNEAIYCINTSNLSIVSSGIYERYFVNEDTIYHHILDTNSGYPVNNNLYSVTVIGPSSKDCDLLSTLLFILGEEKGLKYINSLKDYEALFILKDYSILKSANFPENINK